VRDAVRKLGGCDTLGLPGYFAVLNADERATLIGEHQTIETPSLGSGIGRW